MPQALDKLSSLRTTITRIVREATGLHELLALPVADAICGELQQTFGGAEIYIPAPSRIDRNQAILDDWRRGLSPDTIRRRHGVARATVYRLIARQHAK